MKKLPNDIMRAEDEPGYEKEMLLPSWQCFCCHDSGRVIPNLARLAIDDYDYNKHRLPRCQNPSCTKGSYWDSNSLIDSVDYRFTSEICQELDGIERLGWQNTISLHDPLIREELAKLCQQKNLRKRDRTIEEIRSSEEKHIAALAECDSEIQDKSDTDEDPMVTECEEVCL